MFSGGLIQTMVDRKIINSSTQVWAKFQKKDNSLRVLTLQDNFNVLEIKKHEISEVMFKLIRVETKEIVSVPLENIIMVDGMTAKGFAKAYDLNLDGTNKVMGKRRGRPRKHFPYGN